MNRIGRCSTRIESGKARTPADAAERECRARPAMCPMPAETRCRRRASGWTRIRRAGAIEAQNESASMIPFPRPVAIYNIGLVVAPIFGLSDLLTSKPRNSCDLAVDRLLYANADRADEQPAAVQRPATFRNLGRHVSLAEGCRLFRRTNSRLPLPKGQAA